MPDAARRLTEADLEEIERLAATNAAETYRGPLLALVDEVRRLRAVRERSDRIEVPGGSKGRGEWK